MAAATKRLDRSGSLGGEDNPFKLPPNEDYQTLRLREKEERKKEREELHKMSLLEKTTLHLQKTRRMRNTSDGEEAEAGAEDGEGELPHINRTLNELALQTRSHQFEKESLAEYIKKKRELFLVQYSLGVKNEEMQRLEDIARQEESKLLKAEQTLETDAAKFDAFLKENDRTSVEAIRMAEAQTKIKLDRQAEIKRLQSDIASTRSTISKYEDHLRELQTYHKFIYSLTPKEWLTAHEARVQARRAEQQQQRRGPTGPLGVPSPGTSKPLRSPREKRGMPNRQLSHNSLDSSASPGPVSPGAPEMLSPRSQRFDLPLGEAAPPADSDEENIDDADGEMYFSDPRQLLQLFSELEEHNLSLIQNGQEIEEQLQDLSERVTSERSRLNGDRDALKRQVDDLQAAISAEEERARRFRMHYDFFSSANADEQEAELGRLNEKVEEVYRNSIGENEASINTLQMLTNIENKLEELFEKIEKMPPEKVEEAEKAKEKLRRLRAREEKLEAQRKHQEERVRRALERAKAEPKKQTGKKLMFRSAPPKAPRRVQEARATTCDNEDYQYFFGAD